MPTTGTGATGRPYAVIGRYQWRGEPTQEWVMSRHTRMCLALDRAHAADCAWLRLVGAQAQPLSWFVVDVRDFTEIRLGIATKFGETNGTDENGRPVARRARGPELGRPAAQHARRAAPRR